MASKVTLDQVEELVAQLPPEEQLKLVAHISGRLCVSLYVGPEGEGAPRQADRLRLAEALLAEVQAIENDAQGDFDAAATIRRMRDARIAQICQRGA
jgi:hypothetical protein